MVPFARLVKPIPTRRRVNKKGKAAPPVPRKLLSGRATTVSRAPSWISSGLASPRVTKEGFFDTIDAVDPVQAVRRPQRGVIEVIHYKSSTKTHIFRLGKWCHNIHLRASHHNQYLQASDSITFRLPSPPDCGPC